MIGNRMDYFWYWKPQDRFPPPAITRPQEFAGGDRLTVACTQTDLSAREQRGLVRDWCDTLPTLKGIKLLWFSSRVSQNLFDAACRVPGLEGLYIKWSGITDLSSIEHLLELRYFHLGQSASLKSISPLARELNLRWLGLELLSHVRDLEPLAQLRGLEGLSLEGSMGKAWSVKSLAPVGALINLRYLSIANLRAEDRSLAGIFSLSQLEAFHHAMWWDGTELDEIRRRNLKLT
jgi:hypothetical protein